MGCHTNKIYKIESALNYENHALLKLVVDYSK